MLWSLANCSVAGGSFAACQRFAAGLIAISVLLASKSAVAQWAETIPTAEQRNKEYQDLATESEQLQREANVLRKVAHLAKPTVVHIDSEHNEAASRYGRHSVEEAGSGTIIQSKERFYVLTNRHVIKGAAIESIKIKLADGREITPSRILADPATDIAVLAIQAPGLVPARIGSSNDVEIGDFVLAVGSPFGLSHSITFGIISAKGRRDLDLGDGVKFQDFLQTDAAINPGNSGGPLLNLKGEVIGMNTAIASSSGGSEGIGFTIPIDMVMIVARQLLDHGSVTRAYLGVKLDGKFNATEAIAIGLPRPVGAKVTAITPKSSAELAKIQANDVILEFNGVPVENDSHLMFSVSLTEVGKEVPLVVWRQNQSLRMTVKVGDRSAFPD